jgi:hypothetical protein
MPSDTHSQGANNMHAHIPKAQGAEMLQLESRKLFFSLLCGSKRDRSSVSDTHSQGANNMHAHVPRVQSAEMLQLESRKLFFSLLCGSKRDRSSVPAQTFAALPRAGVTRTAALMQPVQAEPPVSYALLHVTSSE